MSGEHAKPRRRSLNSRSQAEVRLPYWEVLQFRLPAQSQMIRNNPGLAVASPGIYYDADNELAMYYFALDQRLLTEIKAAAVLE